MGQVWRWGQIPQASPGEHSSYLRTPNLSINSRSKDWLVRIDDSRRASTAGSVWIFQDFPRAFADSIRFLVIAGQYDPRQQSRQESIAV